jgi:hypothetical protein
LNPLQAGVVNLVCVEVCSRGGGSPSEEPMDPCHLLVGAIMHSWGPGCTAPRAGAERFSDGVTGTQSERHNGRRGISRGTCECGK